MSFTVIIVIIIIVTDRNVGLNRNNWTQAVKTAGLKLRLVLLVAFNSNPNLKLAICGGEDW